MVRSGKSAHIIFIYLFVCLFVYLFCLGQENLPILYLFICFLFSCLSAPTICCLMYVKKPLPQRILKSFERTHSLCDKPGIIFITRRKWQLCADPNEQWVQDRIQYLSQI
uniref:C-C motif chemokine n=1 Tax=Naja naja TaxID=35670 RepID=A0A8C6VBA9_NAJNA